MALCVSFFDSGLDLRAWRCIVCVIFSLPLNVALSFEVAKDQTVPKKTTDFSGEGISLIGTLILDQDTDGILRDVISGSDSGKLAKYGTGNVTLAAENTYKGPTYINGGSLTGTTKSFGKGHGHFVFNSNAISPSQPTAAHTTPKTSLIIDQDFDGDWNHPISNGRQSDTNTSSVFKRGSGTVTLTTEAYIDPAISTPDFDKKFLIKFSLAPRLPHEWHIEEGTLRAGGQFVMGFTGGSLAPDAGPKYFVGSKGTLDLNGYEQAFIALDNKGTVKLSGAGKQEPGTTLTVNNYVGDGGILELSTVLGDDNSKTDKLIVTGNATGHTTMVVHNAGGLGAKTSGDGIEVVEVGGKSDDNAFSLDRGHVDAGAYQYRLYKGGVTNGDSASKAKNNQNWYLRSQGYRNELPLYAGLPAQMNQDNLAMLNNLPLGNLHQPSNENSAALRLRNNGNSTALRLPSDENSSAPECLGWGQIIAGNYKTKQKGIARVSSKGTIAGFRLGRDLICRHNWHVGGYGGYLRGDWDVSGFANGVSAKVGESKTNAYFLAVYGTYTHASGAYLDLVLQGARHQAGIHPDGNPRSSQHGNSITFSAQAGVPVALGSSSWKVEPQVQLVNQYLDLSDTHISGGTTVRQSHDNAFLMRLGMDLKKKIWLRRGRLFQPYGRVNLYHSPSGADRVTFATSQKAPTTFSSGARYTSTELALGATLEVSKNLKIQTELGRSWSHGGAAKVRADIQGSIGLRASF